MNRRHFVKLSTAASATLLLNQLTYADDGGVSIMKWPDEVWARSADQWYKLIPGGGDQFVYQEIVVMLRRSGDALSVSVQSPVMQLNAIRFKWNHKTDAGAKCLGDHWERSYGDLAWRAPDRQHKNPWYVLFHDELNTIGFGVKTGCNAICWWTVGEDNLDLTLNTQSGGVGVQLGVRKLHLADIVTISSRNNENAFATAQRFCRMMCAKPRLPKEPVYGINDWYFAYGNNSAALIKKTTAAMAELVSEVKNRPFSVVDAGWAEYSPLLPGDAGWNEDFSKPNDKFKDMHLLAADIRQLGMRPGLWMRPLCGRHNEKTNLLAPKIAGRDDPKNPVLDPTVPENIDRVVKNISLYREWGYDLVKHDYTTYDIFGRWGFNMSNAFTDAGWQFNDRSKTNAEIILHLYRSIREAAGNMYIIGCNTMSHLSAGIFELNRIGDDTSGKEWARTRKMGVNTLGFRMPQHNTFYAADGDCVGLTTDIPWEKNKQWMQLLAGSGAPLFISAQPAAVGSQQKAMIKASFAQAAKIQPAGEPLDWLTNAVPARWKLDNQEVVFNWD